MDTTININSVQSILRSTYSGARDFEKIRGKEALREKTTHEEGVGDGCKRNKTPQYRSSLACSHEGKEATSGKQAHISALVQTVEDQ